MDWHKPWMKKNTPNDRGSVETPIATPDKMEISMPLRITLRVPILSAVMPQMNWPSAYAMRYPMSIKAICESSNPTSVPSPIPVLAMENDLRVR